MVVTSLTETELHVSRGIRSNGESFWAAYLKKESSLAPE